MSELRLQRLHKRFDNTAALQGADLVVPAGTITAIVGASGCGKSTLLRCCNGLVRPDSGTISIGNEVLDYRDLPAARRNIGYAVQGSPLFPHLDVRRNISLLAELDGWTSGQVDARVATLMALTQLPPTTGGRYPAQLSGGQQQRVSLCRAMMMAPAVLLLDEPFGALDPLTRQEIHQQLLTLHRTEPTTTLLVTHDIAEAMALADRVAVMHAGRVVMEASTVELGARSDAEHHLLNAMAGAAV